MPLGLETLTGERLGLAILLAAGVAAGWLTLNLESRPNVSLVALPGVLAWWQLGWQPSLAVMAAGAVAGNAMRRTPVPESVASALRMGLAALVASVTAGLITGPAVPLGDALAPLEDTPIGALHIGELLRAAVWLVIASAADWALDLAYGRALPQRRGQNALVARLDVPFALALVPLAIVFHGTYRALSWEPQGVLLGGLFAALLVVRTYTNLRTLHGALERLYVVVEEQRERLDTLVTHSGEAIFTVDPALRIGTANPALEALIGRPASEITGRACAEVCHFEDEGGARLCPERCPLVEAQREGRPVSVDVVYQSPEQAPKHVLLTYAAVSEPSGALRLGIGIARDMTAQREAERLREEFVSLVTHELRSPLTSSTGYLDLLKRTVERAPVSAGLDTAKVLGYVERIQGAERHLLRLVNNLLDIARVERTDLPLDAGEVRLGRIVGEVLDGLAIQAAQKRISVRREGEHELPVTWTSDLYVREILSNLVSNAIKYTPEAGVVTVSLRLRRPTAAEGADLTEVADIAEIAVSDTGYGMSEQDLSRLFGKFFRSGRPEIRKERGTGLGLALSKQMALRLHGDIGVTSTLGEGSTFTLRLPIVPAPSESAPENVPDHVAV